MVMEYLTVGAPLDRNGEVFCFFMPLFNMCVYVYVTL